VIREPAHQAEPDDDDALDEEGDFGNLFAMLRDDYDEESQFTTDFNFIDEDGEVAWVHTKEMALISGRNTKPTARP
jgi:hypothetical protein